MFKKGKVISMKKLLSLILVSTIFLSGCSFTVPDHTIPQETTQATIAPSSNDSVLISIENAEGTVELMVEDNDHFAGAKAEITGDTITQTGDQIIQSKHSVADWGGDPDGAYFFDGSYSVTGPELLESRFCFTPTQPQNFDPLSCSVNFYDLIMEVGGLHYSEASISYCRQMSAIGAEGTVSFGLFPISDEMQATFGVELVTLSCTVEQNCDIKLSLNGSLLVVEATSKISQCVIMSDCGDNGYIASADKEAMGYTISIAGPPRISPID